MHKKGYCLFICTWNIPFTGYIPDPGITEVLHTRNRNCSELLKISIFIVFTFATFSFRGGTPIDTGSQDSETPTCVVYVRLPGPGILAHIGTRYVKALLFNIFAPVVFLFHVRNPFTTGSRDSGTQTCEDNVTGSRDPETLSHPHSMIKKPCFLIVSRL